MRYRVVHTAVLHGGEYYARPERVEAGSEIRLTEAEAARLGNNVAPIEAAVPTPQDGSVAAPPSTAEAKPETGRKSKAKPVKTPGDEG